MRFSVPILCLIAILLAADISFAEKEVYPVAVRYYGEFVCAGGLSDGKWVSSDKIKLPPADVKKDFTLYSATGSVCNASGMVYKDSELSSHTDLSVLRFIPARDDSDKLQYATAAVTGSWDHMPRSVKKDFKFYLYKEKTREFLAENGIETEYPAIDLILKADFDGNGSEETIISGTYYQDKTYRPPFPSKGDYSYVCVISEKFGIKALEGKFFPNKTDNSKDEWVGFKVAGVLDVDNDGIMEVITVMQVFEGGDIRISKINGDRITTLPVY